MSILHKLSWRYAVRKFNTEKIVPESDITEILRATNLSPSALGLQPYEFLVIHNKDLQKKLVPASHNQNQAAEASHLIVLAAKKDISDEYVDEFIERSAKSQKKGKAQLGSHADFIKKLMQEKQDHLAWSENQAYLAAGTLLLAAADLKVDSCPMELIDKEAYDEILELDGTGLSTVLVVALGYRNRSDELAQAKKNRKHLDDMVRLYYS